MIKVTGRDLNSFIPYLVIIALVNNIMSEV